MRGPVPKREEERIGHANKAAGADPVTRLNVSNPTAEQPPVDDDWHPLVQDWYKSLADSGQARFYEPSDWVHAQMVAEIMSSIFIEKEEGKKYPAMLLQTMFGEMTNLMTTEGSRRRLRLEIDRGQVDSGPNTEVSSIMAKYAKGL